MSAETSKFCFHCSSRLTTITPRTEVEIEFCRAGHSMADQDRMSLLEAGRCDNCGRDEILLGYRILESNRVTL